MLDCVGVESRVCGESYSVWGSWNCWEGLVRVEKGVEGQERCVRASGR